MAQFTSSIKGGHLGRNHGTNGDELIKELLASLDELAPQAVTIEERDFTYVIERNKDETWNVRKLSYYTIVVDYTVSPYRGKYICNCPAGIRHRECKHSIWVATIAPYQKQQH